MNDLAALGPASVVVLGDLLVRFGQVSDDSRERTQIVKLIQTIGPNATPAIPALVGVLRDPKQKGLWLVGLPSLGAVGPSAVEAKPAILLVLRWSSSLLLGPVAKTLSQLNAKLDPKEFSLLSGPYREECESGARFPGERVSDDCRELEKALSRLAGVAGLSFRPSPSKPWRPSMVLTRS